MDANFFQFMEYLQGCPASLECIFSNFSSIQNKIKSWNRVWKASKLVFCYVMVKSNVEVEEGLKMWLWLGLVNICESVWCKYLNKWTPLSVFIDFFFFFTFQCTF